MTINQKAINRTALWVTQETKLKTDQHVNSFHYTLNLLHRWRSQIHTDMDTSFRMDFTLSAITPRNKPVMQHFKNEKAKVKAEFQPSVGTQQYVNASAGFPLLYLTLLHTCSYRWVLSPNLNSCQSCCHIKLNRHLPTNQTRDFNSSVVYEPVIRSSLKSHSPWSFFKNKNKTLFE